MLTAGLKCAPESGPKTRISTARMAPVASVLHRSASASSPASFCAMMPEPTTAASKRRSPTIRKMRVVRARASARLGHLAGRSLHAADLLEPLLQAQPIEAADRQRRENANALMQHSVRILERERDLSRGAFGLGWIGNAPMRRHRLAGPHRTGLARGVVADGEGKIERRRAGLGELVPRLRTKARRVVAEALQELDRVRVHSALRLAARTVGTEFTGAELVHDGLGHDRARRVAGAQKQDVERMGHRYLPQQATIWDHPSAAARRRAGLRGSCS